MYTNIYTPLLQHTATKCNTLQHSSTHCNRVSQPMPTHTDSFHRIVIESTQMLPPQDPPDRATQIPWYKSKLDQFFNSSWYCEIIGNLRFSRLQ